MTSENKNRNDTKEYKEVQYGPRRVKIPSEWDFARLGESEYTHLITQGPNPDYSKGELSDEYRALKTKDVYDDGIKYESADRISPEVFKNRSKYQLQEDDVLVAIVGRGSIGKSHIFREQENREYIFTRAIGLVRPNTENILPSYLHHYFQSHDAKEHFLQSITGSTGQEVLRISAIEAMGIPLPPLPEQRRIAETLSTVDTEIEQLNRMVDVKKEMKRGLRQDLLSGSVRTPHGLFD